jgi:hypothetical protein
VDDLSFAGGIETDPERNGISGYSPIRETLGRAVLEHNRLPRGQKHHYVPKFYLKRWAGDDGRLCEFSRPHSEIKPKRRYPDGTAYERGLYTFEDLPPETADYIENEFLKRSDDFASTALCNLLAGEVDLGQEHRNAWSRLIMTLVHRSPEGIERLKLRFGAEFLTEVENFRSGYETWRQPGLPPFDDFIASLTVADLQRMNLHLLQQVMDSKLLGEKLNGMIWAQITFDETHHPLLTGDRPIVMTNGLANIESHIIMPISPRTLFVAANDERQVDHIIRMADAGLAQR